MLFFKSPWDFNFNGNNDISITIWCNIDRNIYILLTHREIQLNREIFCFWKNHDARKICLRKEPNHRFDK